MMEICEIHTVDSVWTICNDAAANNLRNLLSYEDNIWIPGRFGKRKKIIKKYLIDGIRKDENQFLTGYVTMCLDYLDKHNILYKYESDIPAVEFDEPYIDGITFRPYQLQLINSALEYGRGVIKAPTGSGKSIVILGIMSAFSQENILFLVHTTDLVYQMKEDLDKFGFDAGIWTGKDKYLKRITVATVQAYKKIARKHITKWDVVFVDEGHHVTKLWKGNYYDTLSLTAAPCKFATTATLPEKVEAQFALEGLIGPMIDEVTMGDGTALGFLAEPNITMQVVESPIHIWSGRKKSKKLATNYQKVYTEGIVKNTARNVRIAGSAEMQMDRKGTVLILVTRIEHAHIIQDMIGLPTEIVKGAVSKDERMRIKEELKCGETRCVIATVAWVEGVDIPSLTCVINAAGGKSEIQTLQKIGRGLRKTRTKDTVDIIDFHDLGNNFLESHSEQRKGIYESQGWRVS